MIGQTSIKGKGYLTSALNTALVEYTGEESRAIRYRQAFCSTHDS